MDYLHLLGSVALLWAFAAVSPGPNFLMTARIAIARSRREGMQAVAGIGVGTLIWGAAGCFGVQALFIAAPWMHLTLKLMGAAYLIFMGAQLIWRSWRANGSGDDLAINTPLKLSAFKLGLATTIANPRSAVSVASIFATTMPAEPPLALSFAVIAVMIGVSVGWYAFVARVFTAKPLADGYRRARHAIDRVTGGFFILFGVKLAADR
ncbi:LysE family translocator [Terrarubrum flagellatum]|uniref:LysE family translocator n=1 Tax=Terrirubrum flagellatum TaxID=2895980 RepID=UPI0031450A18